MDTDYGLLLSQVGPTEEDKAQARSVAMMRAGLGILSANAPSAQPKSLLGILSQGGLQGMDAYTSTLKDATTQRRTNTLTAMQAAKMKREEEELARTRKIRAWALGELGLGPDGTPIAPPQAPQQQTNQPGILPGGVPPSVVMTGAPAAPWMPQQQQQQPQAQEGSSEGPTRKHSFVEAGNEPPPSLQAKRGQFGPNVNRQAALLALTGDAGLQKIGGWMQDANKPTDKQRDAIALGLVPGTPAYNAYVGTQFNQGGAWQVGPDGGVSLAPGYASGMGAVKSAEEAARASYDFITVPMPGGGTQLLPRSVAAARLGGGQQTGQGGIPHLGQQQPGRGPGNAPALPPQAGGIGIDPRLLPQVGGLGYQRPAAEAGADAEFQKTIAGEFAKNYADLQRADFNAPTNISKYQRLAGLLRGVNTGKFAGTTIQIKAAAKAAGIDLGALGVADDVPQAQAAMSLSNQLALELRSPAGGAGMPGALSDKDREFLVAMVPGLENDPASIPLMIEYRVKLAQRERDVAKLARAYKKKHGRFDDGFYEELSAWSEKNTLFPQTPKTVPGGVPEGFRVIGSRPAGG